MKKLLVLAALLAAPLAHAEPARPLEIKISAAGLDLTNPADAADMIRRMEAAVRPLCVAPGFAIKQSSAGCMRDLMRTAVAKMKIPALTVALERRSAPAITLAQR